MSEALLLSVKQKLENHQKQNPLINEDMKKVIKEMSEIVDIVRDKKLEEGRSLNFLVSDLDNMAEDALHIFKQYGYRTYSWTYDSILSWMGEVKKQMLKLGDDDESNIRSSENVDDEKYVVGLEEDVEFLIPKRIIGGEKCLSPLLIKGMSGIGKTTLAREIYNHPTVIERFERRAWVSNSTHFTTLKELLIKLIQQVPDVIWELCSLRHLYMSNLICRKPLMIGTLENLETLTYVSVDNWTYELSASKLGRLKKLGIEELDGNSDVSKMVESLADLFFLDHLILRGYRFRSMPCLDEIGVLDRLYTLKLDGLFARLPNNLPPNLTSLTLVNSCLDEDPMPLLAEKLGLLKYLKLYTGQQMVILPNAFTRLEKLCIEELWNLRNVQLGERAMDCLKTLEIHDCPCLDTLPKEIATMCLFKELKMVTTKSIAAKMRNSDLISKIDKVNINPMS